MDAVILQDIIMFRIVTADASLRKQRNITSFIFMRIMAGDTGHCIAFFKTFARPEQSILIAMNIDIVRIRSGRIYFKIIFSLSPDINSNEGFVF